MSTDERYPLWCVDTGEPSESQYQGPYALKMTADDEAQDYGGTARKCRQVKASELGLDVAHVMGELFDEPACEGELPDSAWANFDDDIVTLRPEAVDAFWAWANRHLDVKAFVCEGDEADGESS